MGVPLLRFHRDGLREAGAGNISAPQPPKVCNWHHSLDQQLCRWLLLSLDRLSGNQLQMTRELIANMLGVRR